MAEFLLEALSEEIPARMQKRAAAEFSQILTSELEKVNPWPLYSDLGSLE